ncbi:hypothetical protein EW146_g3101 [Bondarzewia mesenterica]|uniref:Fungal lipase-type domain-containing protein n=1 Tax=Bondarzewia mesenterica TaxID=1095465 RepID=A0A4S4M0F4_9AGAM|nr:hypothetical protein EW146_g3101 [Bondarzewia mesenterica]
MAARVFAFVLAAAALLADTVHGAAVKRQSITTLSQTQISDFKPFTFFASTAYCNPSTTLTWTCGANCNANAGFQTTASGGDGDSVQFWYVGWDAAQSTVIVAHQGTDTSDILPIVTDLDFFLTTLDSTLFPGISTSIEVHSGFGDAQAKAATQVLAAVQQTISAHGATTVTVVGHSLGAAISLIDSVYFKLHLPSSVTINAVLYGLPRVGNQAFADYVDANLHVTHINNKEDPVPILPGRFLGFHHPAGEVHIMDSNAWVSCPGQDNTSTECIVGDVPNIFDGDESNHSGPYDGVEMGC